MHLRRGKVKGLDDPDFSTSRTMTTFPGGLQFNLSFWVLVDFLDKPVEEREKEMPNLVKKKNGKTDLLSSSNCRFEFLNFLPAIQRPGWVFSRDGK